MSGLPRPAGPGELPIELLHQSPSGEVEPPGNPCQLWPLISHNRAAHTVSAGDEPDVVQPATFLTTC